MLTEWLSEQIQYLSLCESGFGIRSLSQSLNLHFSSSIVIFKDYQEEFLVINILQIHKENSTFEVIPWPLVLSVV